MNLIDDNEAQIPEQPHDIVGSVDQHRFKRLGRDLQNAARTVEQLLFVRGGNVAVPMGHAHAALVEQLLHAVELIVDQALERGNIQHPHRCGRVLVQLGKDREERRLGLAARGGRGEEQIVVGIKHRFRRRHLHLAQILPSVRIDKLPNVIGKALKYGAHFNVRPPLHESKIQKIKIQYRQC